MVSRTIFSPFRVYSTFSFSTIPFRPYCVFVIFKVYCTYPLELASTVFELGSVSFSWRCFCTAALESISVMLLAVLLLNRAVIVVKSLDSFTALNYISKAPSSKATKDKGFCPDRTGI